MKVILGTELGPIKVYHAEKGKLLGSIDVGGTATALCWLDKECRLFAVAAPNGRVVVCNAETFEQTFVCVAPVEAFKNRTARNYAVCRLIAPHPAAPGSIVAVYDSGSIVVYDDVLEPEVKQEEEEEESGVEEEETAVKEEENEGEEEGGEEDDVVVVKEEPKEDEEERAEADDKEKNRKPRRAAPKKQQKKPVRYVPVDFSERQRRGMTTGRCLVKTDKPVHCAAMGVFRRNTLIAMGGENHNVEVFDLATGNKMWAAAHMAPDPRTKLLEPVWPSALVFLPQGTSIKVPKSKGQREKEQQRAQEELDQLIIKRLVKNGQPKPGVPTPARDQAEKEFAYESAKGAQLLVVATRYNHIRLYDVASGKHAMTDKLVSERPINCMSLDTTNPTRVLFGTTTGETLGFDLTKQLLTGGFRGVSSSVRMCRSCGNVVAVCALDRFMRVYDITQRRLITKIYIKLMPSCMILSGERFEQQETVEKKREDMWEAIAEAPFAPVEEDEEDKGSDESDGDGDDSDDDDDDDDDGGKSSGRAKRGGAKRASGRKRPKSGGGKRGKGRPAKAPRRR